jgi:hypothetical protein
MGRPFHGTVLRRLASFSRLIVFDKRGTGMSDRSPDDRAPLLEDRVNDIASLMDTVGSERAAIMGLSETGAVALLFAATYPERERKRWLPMARSRRGRRWSDLPVGPRPLAPLSASEVGHFAQVTSVTGRPARHRLPAPGRVSMIRLSR